MRKNDKFVSIRREENILKVYVEDCSRIQICLLKKKTERQREREKSFKEKTVKLTARGNKDVENGKNE